MAAVIGDEWADIGFSRLVIGFLCAVIADHDGRDPRLVCHER